jgi:hypothetical protein
LISEKISNWNSNVLSNVLGTSTDNIEIKTPKGRDLFITSNGDARWMHDEKNIN